MTTHSLAFRSIVKQAGYRIGLFTYRDIKEKISYDTKCELVNLIREFCLSRFTTFEAFSDDQSLPALYLPLANRYLTAMQEGRIDCTHEFYLKLFHIYLAEGHLEFDPFDFIMIDEAGDLNEVTLEIFKLLPSSLKIAVGDPYQNIYTFNHTINCFQALKGQGKLFHMSTSFRVNHRIASSIQTFCRATLNPDMNFIGVDTDDEITSRAFITRTNAALIDKMIELNAEQVPYGLARKAKEIFKLPILLASLKYQHFVTDPSYKHLQQHFDEWHEDPTLQHNHSSPLSYLASLFRDDAQLVYSVRLIAKHKKAGIFAAYTEAANHERYDHNLMLLTSHSSKGLEFDEVTIDSGLNEMVAKTVTQVQQGQLDTESVPYRDAMNLYYVACSRAKKRLVNANMLTAIPNLV
mgnify:CR=1 FL=1